MADLGAREKCESRGLSEPLPITGIGPPVSRNNSVSVRVQSNATFGTTRQLPLLQR